MRYKHSRSCTYNINYHVVWCVKYRCKVLTKNVSEFLIKTLLEISKKYNFTIAVVEIGLRDHVHCFITASPTLPITTIIRLLKGISARKIFIAFPELRSRLRHGQLWSNSYFLETIGSTSEDNIKRYIRGQSE